MFSDTHPLAGALAQPLRIKYYVDGFNSFLFAEAAASVSRHLLEEGLKSFPQYSHLFDFELTPEKKASFVAGCLRTIERLIVATQEEVLRASGVEVINQDRAMLARAGLGIDLSLAIREQAPRKFPGTGKTYFDVTSKGVVFCPRMEAKRLCEQLKNFLQDIRDRIRRGESEGKYRQVIKNIEKYQRKLDAGDFHESQRYYTALGKEIGEASRKGYLKCSYSIEQKPITEKGVDGDMGTRITADAYMDVADVFVLFTDDADHFPPAEEARKLGKKVMVMRYSGAPAKMLEKAVGAENIIRFYDHERQNYDKYQFGFDHIWLRDQSDRSLQMLDDMRMQYAWWEMNGQVERPSFPHAPSHGKA